MGIVDDYIGNKLKKVAWASQLFVGGVPLTACVSLKLQRRHKRVADGGGLNFG